MPLRVYSGGCYIYKAKAAMAANTVKVRPISTLPAAPVEAGLLLLLVPLAPLGFVVEVLPVAVGLVPLAPLPLEPLVEPPECPPAPDPPVAVVEGPVAVWLPLEAEPVEPEEVADEEGEEDEELELW